MITLRKTALTLGLGVLVGLVLGFIVGWKVWPVRYVNATPSDLTTSIRDDYVIMISASFARTGDLVTATRRLTALGYSLADVQSLAKEGSARGLSPHQVELLNRLARALAAESHSDMRPPTPSPFPTNPSSQLEDGGSSPQPCLTQVVTARTEILPAG